MTESEKYDVVVIGSGPAGGAVAALCAIAGLKVAIVESKGFGGTCPLRGCNPKKILVNTAEIVSRSTDMEGNGIRSNCGIEWPELIRFKDTFIDSISDKIEQGLKEKGITPYHGAGRFTGPNTVRVDEKDIYGNTIMIGSGAKPRKLDIPGDEHIIDSEAFLNLKTLPSSFVFIGGGYISFEFAHVVAGAGAKVTILEMADRPLGNFDPDMVDMLVAASRRIGIEVHTNTTVERIEKREDTYVVHTGKDGRSTFSTEKVVNGAGRVPATDGLDLEKAGVRYSPNGIVVNQYLQSVSNESVYAAGDVAETPMPLTPTAALEAKAVSRNIIDGNSVVVDHTGIPSAVFTTPPLASAGLTEKAADAKGIAYESRLHDASGWFTAKSVGLKHAGSKLLFEKNTKRIIGAHLFGHHVEEVINILGLAIRFSLTEKDLDNMIWAYPTAGYDIKHMLE